MKKLRMRGARAYLTRIALCAAAFGGCSTQHGGPQDGTETGNPPFSAPSLQESLVALVVSADAVRIVGQPGAATPGAQIEAVSALTDQVFRATVAADGSFDVLVSSSKLDSFEVSAIANGKRSANTVYVVPGAAAVTNATGDSLSCEQRQKLSDEQIRAVAAAADKHCRVDNDCTSIWGGNVCNTGCSSYALSNAGAQEVEAARSAIDTGLCKDYQADGCKSPVHPCIQFGEPTCVGSTRCAYAVRDGSDPYCTPLDVCVNGVAQQWQGVCRASVSDEASQGLHPVCIVDAQGRMALAHLGGDVAVTNRGWSSSEYGQIPSTLSPNDETKCAALLDAAGTVDAGAALSPCAL